MQKLVIIMDRNEISEEYFLRLGAEINKSNSTKQQQQILIAIIRNSLFLSFNYNLKFTSTERIQGSAIWGLKLCLRPI